MIIVPNAVQAAWTALKNVPAQKVWGEGEMQCKVCVFYFTVKLGNPTPARYTSPHDVWSLPALSVLFSFINIHVWSRDSTM